ncbi:DNA polymerase III subunit epsilon [Sulfuricella denitrificans skB26]|uniref:DNA-directed DNA polymerase n=1 Tax=Sulfuricella denitrificans (strain DSM 22764 / NBRC 105220 / skB26) TaxID=1163617 RepID=S6AJU4_SULDS|nr:3'-5' exonuclease [Sulfuricella denitrificans]BAN34834.1 DNA polymerase III subunit epsilon [Sulfuricella denitrificans skB26]
METVAVIDFETTGLSPAMGDRATEVAVVIVADGKIVDRYQSLMNTGTRIPAFIEALTGISNTMISKAPPASEVMRALAEFVRDIPLVAHNASFDSKFLDAEWLRINQRRRQEFACSMLLARRIYPSAPNHKLGTLVRHLGLPSAARHHRALADAEMTAHLWVQMVSDIQQQYGLNTVPHEFLLALQKAPKTQMTSCVERAKCRLGL